MQIKRLSFVNNRIFERSNLHATYLGIASTIFHLKYIFSYFVDIETITDRKTGKKCLKMHGERVILKIKNTEHL